MDSFLKWQGSFWFFVRRIELNNGGSIWGACSWWVNEDRMRGHESDGHMVLYHATKKISIFR